MKDTTIFGKRLRYARNYFDLTMRQLENECGVDHACIGNYERGKREAHISNLKILANYFDCTTDWLLGLEPLESFRMPKSFRVVDYGN